MSPEGLSQRYTASLENAIKDANRAGGAPGVSQNRVETLQQAGIQMGRAQARVSVVTSVGVSFIAFPSALALNSLQGVSHPNVIAVLATALPVATNVPIPQASKWRLPKGACCSLVSAAAAGLELLSLRRLRAPPRPPLLHAASSCAGQEPHRGHRARLGSGLVPPLLWVLGTWSQAPTVAAPLTVSTREGATIQGS